MRETLITKKCVVRRVKKPRKKNDELLKGAFEEYFVEFLSFVYPDADEVLDFSKPPEFMDKELFSIDPDRERKNDKRAADLLAKLHLKDGSEKWVLLNVEIEGGNDADFAFRVYQYHYRIWERYNVSVATIAVFIGDKGQRRPTQYHEELLGTVLSFKYPACHVFDYSEEELLANQNPFALVVLVCQKALLEGKIPDTELNEERLSIVRALLSRGYDRNKIINFISFLKNIIFIKDKRINRTFDNNIIKLTGGEINMGIMEVIKMQERRDAELKGQIKGKLEEKKEIARELKKEGLSIDFIAKTTKLSIKQIESL